MSARAWIGLALAVASGAAWADDKGHMVRATATVEVIEDARQVDDIIARVRAREAAEKQREPAVDPRAERPANADARVERPALPEARLDGKHGADRARAEAKAEAKQPDRRRDPHERDRRDRRRR